MVLLFLLALLLAWPTAGLSIIAYVAFAVFKSYLNAKSRAHYANERRAEREVISGGRHVPSWAGNNVENQIFVEAIQKVAIRKGVSQTFLWAVLGDKETLQNLVFLAGAMEREGASFIEQQVAICDKLVDMWERAPTSVRTAALSGGSQSGQPMRKVSSASAAQASNADSSLISIPNRINTVANATSRSVEAAASGLERLGKDIEEAKAKQIARQRFEEAVHLRELREKAAEEQAERQNATSRSVEPAASSLDMLGKQIEAAKAKQIAR